MKRYIAIGAFLLALLMAGSTVIAGPRERDHWPLGGWDAWSVDYWEAQFPGTDCWLRQGPLPDKRRHDVIVIWRAKEWAVRVDKRATKNTRIICDQ